MKDILSKLKKLFIRFVVVILIAALLTFVVAYFLNYSKGERSGKIVKLSERGILIKTWECEMNMQSISMDGTPTQWEFSIPRGRKDLLEKIREAMKLDATVQVYYEEKMLRIFWEGDTKYWIKNIEMHPK